MDDFQNLMALKKAYAEIILGMAKEAAARVMAAERRASQSQEELLGSKEEALRLLLRLKQMADAKLSEAETTSAWQREIIKELEAQLQEANNTVKELREELKEAQDELENERTHKSHQAIMTPTTGDTVKPEEVSGESRRHISGSIGQSQSDLQAAYEVSGMNISSNKVSVGSNCSCKGQALKDYCCVHNHSSSVSVTRSKEPKHRRNKGSQRVQAFENNSSAQLSFSGQEENVEHQAYNGGRKVEVSALISNLSVDKKHGRKREPSAMKLIKADCNAFSKCSPKKRKRTPGCRSKNTSWGKQHDMILTEQRATDVLSFRTSKKSHPPCRLRSPSKATEVTEKLGALATCKDAELVNSGIMVDATIGSKTPKESEITREVNGGVQLLSILAATSDQDKVNDLSNSDLKASSVSDGSSGRPLHNNYLITFTRRKKETLRSPDGTVCVDESMLKKKGQKHDQSLEPENSALTCETSQDNQQLVQIAEQLMSLRRNKRK